MRLLLQEYRRRIVVPLAAAGLALYYLLVYLPLARRTAQLDRPLQHAWTNLAASIGRTNSFAIDFTRLTNQVERVREALAKVESARGKATARLTLNPEIQARMTSPFQLVEYDNERSKAIVAWIQLAKGQNVAVDPAVYSGLPEHTAEVREPELLWPTFSMVDGLVTSAINAKIATLHTLQARVVLTNSPGLRSGLVVNEVPIELEFTGNAPEVLRFVQSLPLNAEEIQIAGLPATSAGKPPLFLDRLVIKKQNPAKTDEVRVWLRALGFVLRE